MKRGYSKKTYHQRSKDETIFSVVKRTMGDEVRSIGVKAQNNEMRMKIISYNAARIASLAYSLLRGFLQSRCEALVTLRRVGCFLSTFLGRIKLLCARGEAPRPLQRVMPRIGTSSWNGWRVTGHFPCGTIRAGRR